MEWLKIKTSTELVRVRADEIVYVRADGNYSDLMLTSGRKLTLTFQLHFFDECFKQLQNNTFVRVGRSYIVNYCFYITKPCYNPFLFAIRKWKLSGKNILRQRKKLNSMFGVQLLFCFFVFTTKTFLKHGQKYIFYRTAIINNGLWRHLKSCLYVAFVFVHQSHSPLCSFFTKTKLTKNTIKTIPTYYFTVT